MPWLNMSNCKRTIFVEPLRPRGGLLGGGDGGAKMSKLQALAALRKKKIADQKVNSGTNDHPEISAAGVAGKENTRPSREVPDIAPVVEQSALETANHLRVSELNLVDQVEKAPQNASRFSFHISAPSAFARTVCSPTVKDPLQAQTPQRFFLPYMSSPQFAANAFFRAEPR